MNKPNTLKVEYVDKDTMTVVEDYWNIQVKVDEETGELTATYIAMNPEFDKELEIRVKV